MLSILGETLILLFTNTALSKNYVLKELDEQNYYANVYTNVLSEMKNYIGPSGFDETIFDDVVSKDKLEKDVHIVLGNIYDGKKEEISSEEVEKKLEKNINKFLKKQNLEVEDKSSIEDFKSRIGEVYKENVSYDTYTQYLSILSSSKLRKIIEIGKNACFAGIIVSAILFVLVNIKNRKKIISEIMTSLFACGIIFMVACIYFEAKVKIDAITLLNVAVTIVVRDMISTIISTLKNIGIIYIVSSCAIILINNFIFAESKKHRNESTNEED